MNDWHARHLHAPPRGYQWVNVDGDVARSRSYWLFYGNVSAHGPVLRAMGSYEDTLVRTPSGWKVARREVTHGV